MLRRSAALRLASVTSFALKDVAKEASPADVITASWNGSVFKYTAFPGVEREDVCKHLLRLPLFDRGVHAVFARDEVPVDFAVDIDGKVPMVTREGKPTPRPDRDGFLTDIVNAVIVSLDKELAAIGAGVEQRYVLQSTYTSRVSAHLHVRLSGERAFEDWAHMGAFAKKVSKGVVPPDGVAAYKQGFLECVDLNIYRRSGTLRLFNAVNRHQQSPLHLVPRTATTKGREHWVVGPTDPVALLEASLITRNPLDVDELITVPGAGSLNSSSVGDASGLMPSSSGASIGRLPDDPQLLLRIACEALVRLAPRYAESYRPWSIVFLTAKSTAARLAARGVTEADEALRSAFHDFSRLSPEKYKPSDVDKKWRSRQRAGVLDTEKDPRCGIRYLVQRAASPPPSLKP
jgi:hypothetical protein